MIKNSFARALCILGAVALLVTSFAPLAVAQDLHPSRRPSPMGMARTFVGDAYVRVIYSRPYQRDRDNIFGADEAGALVPYGKVWRTGANEATEITLTAPVNVGGEELAAGTYSLFTTPGEKAWKVHFNSSLGLWGVGKINRAERRWDPIDPAESDVLVVSAEASSVSEDDAVDQFTIAFESGEEGASELVLSWAQTEVRLPFNPAS